MYVRMLVGLSPYWCLSPWTIYSETNIKEFVPLKKKDYSIRRTDVKECLWASVGKAITSIARNRDIIHAAATLWTCGGLESGKGSQSHTAYGKASKMRTLKIYCW